MAVRCLFLLHPLRIHLLKLDLHAKPATSPKWPGATKKRKPEKVKTGESSTYIVMFSFSFLRLTCSFSLTACMLSIAVRRETRFSVRSLSRRLSFTQVAVCPHSTAQFHLARVSQGLLRTCLLVHRHRAVVPRQNLPTQVQPSLPTDLKIHGNGCMFFNFNVLCEFAH